MSSTEVFNLKKKKTSKVKDSAGNAPGRENYNMVATELSLQNQISNIDITRFCILFCLRCSDTICNFAFRFSFAPRSMLFLWINYLHIKLTPPANKTNMVVSWTFFHCIFVGSSGWFGSGIMIIYNLCLLELNWRP